MPKLLFVLFSLVLIFSGSWNDAVADGKPSAGAENMPGAMGTIEYKPTDWQQGATTWWKDTDGVDPGKAGCHIGTDADGKPNGRIFAEACAGDGFLIESNPGADVLHMHKDDIGHPDRFDCNAWCKGQEKSDGMCVAAAAPLCEKSAVCSCS
jgi:hypothetical protein